AVRGEGDRAGAGHAGLEEDVIAAVHVAVAVEVLGLTAGRGQHVGPAEAGGKGRKVVGVHVLIVIEIGGVAGRPGEIAAGRVVQRPDAAAVRVSRGHDREVVAQQVAGGYFRAVRLDVVGHDALVDELGAVHVRTDRAYHHRNGQPGKDNPHARQFHTITSPAPSCVSAGVISQKSPRKSAGTGSQEGGSPLASRRLFKLKYTGNQLHLKTVR